MVTEFSISTATDTGCIKNWFKGSIAPFFIAENPTAIYNNSIKHKESAMIIDITQEVLGCKVYPGDPSPMLVKQMDMNKGDLYNLSALSMGCHNGTHIDAPAHFFKDGGTVDTIPLESCVGHCFVSHHYGDVSASDAKAIMEKRKLADADKRILLAGDCVVTADAAQVFADHKILLIGNSTDIINSL